MNTAPPIVISASRRTDIPSFYMPWLMNQLEKGGLETVNPYNRRRQKVSADPDEVHSIVFWSKNYGPFLKGRYGERLRARGYRLFFHFTVNSSPDPLENGLPDLANRLDQAEELCRRFGPETITWRFDPILYFRRNGNNEVLHNLNDFEKIADQMAACGIERCITSFADPYQKAVRRMSKEGLTIMDPSDHHKIEVLLQLAAQLTRLRIGLSVCSEKALLRQMDDQTIVSPAACIDHALLQKIFGGELSFKRDTGQRQKAGCRCDKAIDIGDYSAHPCYHYCLYCYANPVQVNDTTERRIAV